MTRQADDLTATKIRERPIEEADTVVDDAPPQPEDSNLSGPYQYYESSPDRDDEETRRIVRNALKLLLGSPQKKQK